MSVHYRVIFILHRQVGTAGTNRCRCVQLARANKAKLARERRVQKTARANRPCELQAWAVVRAGCARLSPRNNGSCGAVRQRRAMARSWFAAPAVWSRGCTTAHASSSKPSARGMLCPAGLLLVHKHAATANATQNQRGYLPRQASGAAGELQGEEERNWSHGFSLLLDFSPK